MEKRWNIALVGATGEDGDQLLEALAERGFPLGEIRLLTEDGAGDILEIQGRPVMVEKLSHSSFKGVEIAFFAAGEEISREYAPVAAEAGAACIDLSPAWRMADDVPLVVPEVNPDDIAMYRERGIVSVPNGAAIQLAMALKPLHKHAGIRRVIVSSYQSVSTSGKGAVEELRSQTIDLMSVRPVKQKTFSSRIAFNCLPHVGDFDKEGYSADEREIAEETAKLLGAKIGVTATTVHVPVFYGLCQAVNIETEKKLTATAARKQITAAPGCRVVDNPPKGLYPMPSEAAGQDMILVGRIREDGSIANGLNLWLSGDDIRNRANCAVAIAEILADKYL